MSDPFSAFSPDELLSNLDLESVDIVRPLIDNQFKRVRLGDVRGEVRKSRKGEQLKYLVVPIILEESVEALNYKKPLEPGRELEHSILVSTTGGLTQEMINERLAKLKAAALREARADNTTPWSDLAGRSVMVKFRVNEKDGTQRQEMDFYPVKD